MTAWSEEELRKIAAVDDLHISPFREDRVTYGTPIWIWSVAVRDAISVRGYNGLKSRWYQAAVQKNGRADYSRWHDEGGHLRGCERTDQRPGR
jgi:hypothetical protein